MLLRSKCDFSLQFVHFLTVAWSEGNRCCLWSILWGHLWRSGVFLYFIYEWCKTYLLVNSLARYSFCSCLLFSTIVNIISSLCVSDSRVLNINGCLSEAREKIHVELKFALPGKERQDSVYRGLQVCQHYFRVSSAFDKSPVTSLLFFSPQAVDSSSELLCIHDSARPLVSSSDTKKVCFRSSYCSSSPNYSRSAYYFHFLYLVILSTRRAEYIIYGENLLNGDYLFYCTKDNRVFDFSSLLQYGRFWRMVGWLERQSLVFLPKLQSKRY